MKKVIRLTEGDLHKIVNEVVTNVLQQSEKPHKKIEYKYANGNGTEYETADVVFLKNYKGYDIYEEANTNYEPWYFINVDGDRFYEFFSSIREAQKFIRDLIACRTNW